MTGINERFLNHIWGECSDWIHFLGFLSSADWRSHFRNSAERGIQVTWGDWKAMIMLLSFYVTHSSAVLLLGLSNFCCFAFCFHIFLSIQLLHHPFWYRASIWRQVDGWERQCFTFPSILRVVMLYQLLLILSRATKGKKQSPTERK